MKKIIKNLILFIFSLVPINNSKIIFESNSEIKDSSKALFEESLRMNVNEKYKIIWFVEEPAKYKKNYENIKNVKFVKKSKKNSYSLKFLYHCCTAKYCFYTHIFIGQRLWGNQRKVFLTHGTPIKDTRGCFWDPYKNTDIISTSKFAALLRCKTFNGGDDLVRILGFPRNDCLFTPEANTLEYIKNGNYDKIIIWLPTFKHFNLEAANRNDFGDEKDKDISILSNDFLKKLNILLSKHNAMLYIKFHPAQNLNYVEFYDYSNIVTMTNAQLDEKDLDLYSLLSLSSALITDYSSVYIDYLLTNKPIGFELADYESFKKGRGFIVDDPLQYMPGEKITNQTELYRFIENVINEKDNYKKERNKLKHKMHKYCDGDSSKRVLEYFGLIEKKEK